MRDRFVFKAGPRDYRVKARDSAGIWREVGGFATRAAATKYVVSSALGER